MITTNLLFACLGIAFIAFGVIGERDRFKGASLFPELTFKRTQIEKRVKKGGLKRDGY